MEMAQVMVKPNQRTLIQVEVVTQRKLRGFNETTSSFLAEVDTSVKSLTF